MLRDLKSVSKVLVLSSRCWAVKSILEELGFTPTCLDVDEFARIKGSEDFLSSHGFSWGLVFNFGKKIPSEWIKLIPLVNIHYSLLPRYRGPLPVVATVLNGDSEGGITCHMVSEEIDKGKIICQQRYKLPEYLTTSELTQWYDAKLNAVISSLIENLENILKRQGVFQRGVGSYAGFELLNLPVNIFTLTAEEFTRRVLAFNPEPLVKLKVKFNDTVRELVLYKVLPLKEFKSPNFDIPRAGQIVFVRKLGMVLGTALGGVVVTEAALAGKKRLKRLDLLSLKGKITKVLA